jgi:PAS domain-containing protein
MASMLGYDSYAELMRVTNETSIGQVLYADPSHRETVLQHVERNPGQWQTFENRYRRKDGQIIDAILSIGKNRDTAKGELVLYGIVCKTSPSASGPSPIFAWPPPLLNRKKA